MTPAAVAASVTLGGMRASPARLRLTPAQRGVVAVHGAWGGLSAWSENRLVRVVVLQARRLVVVTATGETGRDEIAIGDARGDRTMVPVVAQVRMDPLEVASGVVDVRLLRGGPLEMVVVATPVGGDPRAYLRGPRLPGEGHHRTGVFTLHGVQRVKLSYVARRPGVWTEIGTRRSSPRPLPGSRGRDIGAYGVLEHIDVALRNPLSEPSPLYQYEQPLGGPVRSFFLVDGAPIQLGCVRVPRRYRIAAFELAPGGNYLLRVLAKTDGGSFYPLRIGVTVTPPDPHVPPVRAPDGCFPK